jgi:hypothetical protein
MKKIVSFVSLIGVGIASLPVVAQAASCESPLSKGETFQLSGFSAPLRFIEQDDVDTAAQSTTSQKYALVGFKGNLSDSEARQALTRLHQLVTNSCRKNPIQGANIFLYPSPSAATGRSWIGRAFSRDGKLSLTVQPNMVTNGQSGKVKQKCVPGSAPGKSYKGDNVTLPPVAQRKILGTWAHYSGLTMSLEEIRGTVYQVYRDSYCSSGADGVALRNGGGGRYFRKESMTGDYYQILPRGELGVFDKDGKIDVYTPHNGLYTAK